MLCFVRSSSRLVDEAEVGARGLVFKRGLEPVQFFDIVCAHSIAPSRPGGSGRSLQRFHGRERRLHNVRQVGVSAFTESKQDMKKTQAVLILASVLLLSSVAMSEGTAGPNELQKVGQNTLDTSEALKKLLASMLVIIVLGGAAIYLTKKVMPKVNAAMGKEIKVIESLRLGPRKHLYLVRIGNRKLLVAGGGESVNCLADVTEALAQPPKDVPEGQKNA